jgi:alkanesulfonate monooxygenase SsuD/methylene tetrahydromethanopterin reductase-like flavin-dependent oxidoreductase (luciferase family)
MDMIVYADELGFDYVWLTEHHFVEDGYLPSLLPIAAAIAARTKQILINTYAFLLPLHNALRVAEDVAVIDNLSNGRMELGVGTGYRIEEFEGFGIDRHARKTIMDESCEILLKAWTEENWSFSGHHYTHKNVSIHPRPVQQPHPPLWISARAPVSARRAARFRTPLLIAPPIYTGPGGEHSAYEAYAQQLRAQGDDPAAFEVGGTFTALVTDDIEGTLAEMAGISWMTDLYANWYGAAGDLSSDAAKISNPDPETLANSGIVGDVETVITGLERWLARGIPYSNIIVGGSTGGLRKDGTNPHMAAFAKHVIPYFRSKELANR